MTDTKRNGNMKTTDQIKAEAFMSILNMEDGEYAIRGGRGNKVLKEIKVENGIHYEKIDGEWVEINMAERVLRLMQEPEHKPKKMRLNMLKHILILMIICFISFIVIYSIAPDAPDFVYLITGAVCGLTYSILKDF